MAEFRTRYAFFDSPEVMARVDKGKRKVFSKFGAFVRRRAKSSIRYKAKGISAPGDPPFAHRSKGFTKKKFSKKTGQTTQQPASPIRELIFFSWDERTKSMVVGPIPFRGSGEGARRLEKGGTMTKLRKNGSTRTLHYRPRPFMNPALEAERPSFADQLRGMMGK